MARARSAGGREFAILTDVLHRGTFGIKTEEHRVIKQLKRRDNLRDSMTSLELVLSSLAEATATELHQAHDSQGFDELGRDAHQAGGIAGTTRQQIEAQSGRSVVSPDNHATLTARATQPQLPLSKDPTTPTGQN